MPTLKKEAKKQSFQVKDLVKGLLQNRLASSVILKFSISLVEICSQLSLTPICSSFDSIFFFFFFFCKHGNSLKFGLQSLLLSQYFMSDGKFYYAFLWTPVQICVKIQIIFPFTTTLITIIYTSTIYLTTADWQDSRWAETVPSASNHWDTRYSPATYWGNL